MGWLGEQVVFGIAYLATAAALWASGQSVRRGGGLHASSWFVLAVFASTAAVLRWTGAGNRVSDTFRERARGSGWYVDRASMQLVAVIGLVGILLAAAAFVTRHPRARVVPRLVSLGLCGSMLVASVRIVSLHEIDSFVSHRLLGLRVLVLLEGAAVAATLVGIWRWRRSEAGGGRAPVTRGDDGQRRR